MAENSDRERDQDVSIKHLQRQVRRAQWWLGLQRFVAALGWCLFGSLLLAVVALVIDKYWPLGLLPWVWPAIAVGVGMLAAAAWAVLAGRGEVDAAIEIDRRFGLKERVSSTLAMSEEERQTEVGQALVRDAVRRVERIDVGEHFTVRPGRQTLLPLIPAVAAIAVVLLLNPAADNTAEGKTDPALVQKQIENAKKTLEVKLAEKREKAKALGLKDAENLFKQLQAESEKSDPKLEPDKREAMIKLSDLAEKLAKRSKELGGAEAVQKQLEQLKNFDNGPAEKLINALSRGELKKAQEEFQKLKEKLEKNELTEKEREELGKQMEQMKDKMHELAEAHRQAMDALQKQIDQARQAGDNQKASELEEQLAKLQAQIPQMNQMEKLAEKMGQCAQCMKNGQMKEAAEAMQAMQGDLQNLQQQLQEFQMMQDAMAQLEQVRDQMNCQACGGAGCDKCNGPPGMGMGMGMGMGAGRGEGLRPQEENETDFFDTKAATKAGKGSADIVGRVDGPNRKGDLQTELVEQEQAFRTQPADPMTDLHIPKKYQENVREYLDRLREGK